MNERKIATLVGVLFILGTAAGVLSVVCLTPVLNAQDVLLQAAENKSRVTAGALFILLMGLALALIPAVLYPLFQRYSAGLALGYAIFRGGLETVTYLVQVVAMLLLPLAGQAAQAGAAPEAYAAAGRLLRGAGAIGSELTIVFFGLGALMLYYFLYQTRLVPRWLSIWGFIAILLHIATFFLLVFDILDDSATIVTLLNMPIFLQEMVMAVWLIAKGFNPAAVAALAPAATKTSA